MRSKYSDSRCIAAAFIRFGIPSLITSALSARSFRRRISQAIRIHPEFATETDAVVLNGDAAQQEYPSYLNAGGPVSTLWTVEGVGDFDGDAHADIFWRHQNGETAIWLMDGSEMIGERQPGVMATSTTLQAIGDFDGNLRSDILWRTQSGQLVTWFDGGWHNGVPTNDAKFKVGGPSYQNQINSGTPAPVNSLFVVQGVGDFNHDGRDDILWRSGNALAIWYLDGVRYLGEEPVRGPSDPVSRWVDTSWVVQGMMHEHGF